MVQFLDLKTQREILNDGIKGRMDTVLDHGMFIMGPEVAELEKTMADFSGAKHAVSCASGTDSLVMSLVALGIGPGDEVIVPSFTFIATAEAVSLVGGTPVFVDVDLTDFNMSVAEFEKKITPNTKVVIPVSLYGQPADFDAINEVAKKHNITVIEDAAQSYGASYNGRKSCGLSTLASTSFFPAKPLGCYGDGGAIFTDNDEIAEHLKQIRNHGQTERYIHSKIGLNGRLDTLQAAVLLAKHEHYEKEEISLRQKAAAKYTEMITDLIPEIICPEVMEGREHVWAQYTIRLQNRDNVRAYMGGKSVPVAVHYPMPLNAQPVYKHLGFDEADFTNSIKLSQEVMSLPLHPYLKDEHIEKVVTTLRDGYQQLH